MNRIRECRRKMGLTQVELSKALNISQGTLSGYETGRFEPDVDTMQRLADFLFKKCTALLCGFCRGYTCKWYDLLLYNVTRIDT